MGKTAASTSGVEEWLDTIDPTMTPARDSTDLRHITEAAQAVDDAVAALNDAVGRARADGHSWASIGMVLGVSRQAAQQRFGAASDHR